MSIMQYERTKALLEDRKLVKVTLVQGTWGLNTNTTIWETLDGGFWAEQRHGYPPQPVL